MSFSATRIECSISNACLQVLSVQYVIALASSTATRTRHTTHHTAVKRQKKKEYTPVVLFDVVEVLATDDDCASHLCRDDGASQDAAANGDAGGEGTLFVNVFSLCGLLGGLEAEANVVEPVALGLFAEFGVCKDADLLLERAFGLFSESHGN